MKNSKILKQVNKIPSKIFGIKDGVITPYRLHYDVYTYDSRGSNDNDIVLDYGKLFDISLPYRKHLSDILNIFNELKNENKAKYLIYYDNGPNIFETHFVILNENYENITINALFQSKSKNYGK